MNGMLWINIPYACFGVVVRDGKITEAAPIAKWMVGKTVQQVEAWVNNRKGQVRRLIQQHPSNTAADAQDSLRRQ